MSWKSRNLPALVEAIPITSKPKKSSAMIEHSITKYSIVLPTYTPPLAQHQRPSWMDHPKPLISATGGRQFWSYARCMEYKTELEAKGLCKGAAIVTKYGIAGTIGDIREIPPAGIDFAGYDTPNMFMILRPGITMSHLLYNEEEITLDTTTTTKDIPC